ncbi:hypothetical protein HPB48_022740 [Haemaphysalis longicornis]|uniref:SF3 helicase domain-containing protein n=1 Tax=Haemaphysalis longicornis TaxID=44386 RepID=A0A9J6FNG2_HAELO|nr:hypothetical protein HPB48_022740 [Haemaphysalis longicornis]
MVDVRVAQEQKSSRLYYKLAFIASHDPDDGSEYIDNRDTSWNDEQAFKIRRALSMHRTPLEEVFGNEVCIDFESGDVYKCRTMPVCLKLGDANEVRKAVTLLDQERDLMNAVDEREEAEDEDEDIQQLVQSLKAKKNKKKKPGDEGPDDDNDDDDDDDGRCSGYDEDNIINNALEEENLEEDEEYEMDKDDNCNRRSITAQAIEDAQRSPAGFLRFVNSVYDEETELQNAKDTKLGRAKRTIINSYDVHYIRWFTKLTPLIVSNMGYSGMSLYRVLCTNVCAGNIGDDAGIAFNRCVQYLFECSPQQTEDGKSMVVMPRAVYRPKFEPPFQMNPEEKTDAKWIIQTYAQCNFLCVPFFIKYVFYLVSQGKCVLIHDTSEDKYDTLKYNKDMGIYQTDNVINLILPLQTLIFKTILHNLTCKDPNSPLDLLFKLYDGLATLINQQKPIKLDANPSETERYKCSLSKEYLVFSNGTTFNCETSEFEKWGEHQICMRRVGLDIDYGATEWTEHSTIEIHPLSGGIEYLYKVFRMFILYALKVINRSHLTAFSRHKPVVNTMSPWKGIFAMFSPAEFAEIEAMQEEYTRDRDNTSAETVWRLREAYNLGCIYHMVTTFLMVRPDLYVELIDSGELGVDMDNMEVDDDGGPVVIVRRRMSYEDKVLAMMDGIFGGRERTNIVLRFLAIGLRTDGTGRNALYLHGEAMNGKSAFMNVLSAGMGGQQSQMVIHLPGDYFTNRGSNQMDATFKDCNRDARFLYVPEIAISDMGPAGRRKFKRLTGGDVIADRVPYGKKNILYVNNAKFIGSSNDIPRRRPRRLVAS